MPDFTLWDIVWLFLILAIVQAGTHFLFEAMSKWFEKRKNNTVCDLYINDEFIGKQTYEECQKTYDDEPFRGCKGYGFNKKTKVFHIDVDKR